MHVILSAAKNLSATGHRETVWNFGSACGATSWLSLWLLWVLFTQSQILRCAQNDTVWLLALLVLVVKVHHRSLR